MSTKRPYPEFASEADEARWLHDHDGELDYYFEPANRSLTEMLLRDHNLVLPQNMVTVPLSPEDVASAKAIAEGNGLSAEEYLGQILHEALEAKRAA